MTSVNELTNNYRELTNYFCSQTLKDNQIENTSKSEKLLVISILRNDRTNFCLII